MRYLLLAFGLLTACAGDDTGPRTCTGSPYDSCQEEHDCMSAICRPFGDIVACTQACTVGDNSTCPKQGSTEVVCGADALCAPTAVNDCILSVL
ncbi:MAG: hypothetical protein NT062_13960 [Proteobacteria bacterium]|nr:hypothetical protein [Pseudomonadota bacterium]